MITLYYQPATASLSSSLDVVSADPLGRQLNVQSYLNVSLVTSTGSGVYNIYSSSVLISSYPIENTVVYYSASYSPQVVINGSTFLPTQSEYQIQFAFTPDIISPTTSDTFKITGPSYTSSFSQSGASGTDILNINTPYVAILSGSGEFYDSSLTIINTSTGATASYVTASNSYISASFSSSVITDNFNIIAQTQTSPYIRTTFSSSASIPVSPTSSLASWSAYLNVTASFLSSSDNTFWIVGKDLNSSTTTAIIITGSGLSDYYESGVSNITSYSLYNNKLSSFPNIVTASNNIYFNVDSNLISGSLPDLENTDLLVTFIASNNKLSGSINNLSGSYSLQYFDASNNYLTGGIDLARCFNLTHFDVSNNQLSGSLSVIASTPDIYYSPDTDIPNIKYLDISNNALIVTGGLNISNLNNLRYFDASNNRLSGITVNNAVSYSIQSFANWSLEHFDISNNLFTGSFPYLQTLELEFNPTGSLKYFNVSNNAFSGTIDLREYLYTLETLAVNNNKISDYYPISGSGYTVYYQYLTTFNAENNLLSQSAVDNILNDLASSQAISGTVNLSGSGNAAPSTTGLTYTSSLKSKGWTVYVN